MTATDPSIDPAPATRSGPATPPAPADRAMSPHGIPLPPDLPGGLSLHDYAGGVVIRAGTHPQMGDINMGNIPEAYCAVSDALRPIRFEDYQQNPMDLIRVPRPLDAYEETMNWLRRFDVVD